MEVDRAGCPLCGSTWGNVWEEVEGGRMFFCCERCALQLRGLLARVKSATGWSRVDALELEGDRRGRRGLATHGDGRFRFFVAFNAEGEVRKFDALPVDDPGGPPAHEP